MLVALADHANDESFSCWPSVTHLQKKTGVSRPTVWRLIDRLVDRGLVERAGSSDSMTTIYTLKVGNEVHLGNGVHLGNVGNKLGNLCNILGNASTKVGNGVTPNPYNPKETKEPKTKREASSPPPGLDLAVWDRWVEYRKQIRKPLKPASIQAAQVALAAFGCNQLAVVEQSIANGWTGLFELKRGANAKNQHDGRSRAKRVSDTLDEIARESIERERMRERTIDGTLDRGDP